MMMMIIMMMIPLRNERGMDEEYYYYYYYWWYSDSWWSCFAVTTVGMSPTTIAIVILQRPVPYNTTGIDSIEYVTPQRIDANEVSGFSFFFLVVVVWYGKYGCVNQKIVGWSFTRLKIVSVLALTPNRPRFPDSPIPTVLNTDAPFPEPQPRMWYVYCGIVCVGHSILTHMANDCLIQLIDIEI